MAVTSSKALRICTLEQRGEVNYENDDTKLALVDDDFDWDGKKHKAWDASEWESETVYAKGDIVKPTSPTGYLYRCITGGETAASEPSWPETFEDTKSDGDAEWECWSYHTKEHEITQENGYTGPVTLQTDGSDGMTVTENESDTRSEATADDVEIKADGGSFGPTKGAVLFNDTHAEKPMVGYISFGSDFTPEDGVSVKIEDIMVTDKAIQGVTA
ncbi:MAG: hypothetical protein ACLFQ9_09685 [Desulfobacterales bacterium]